MTFQNRLRPGVHRKAWESLTSLMGAGTSDGGFLINANNQDNGLNGLMFWFQDAATWYSYDWRADAWLQMPPSGATGSFNAGSCGEFRAICMAGGTINQTATGGTTTTINTNKTGARDVRGAKVRIVSGTGVGYEGTVVSSTIGTNSTLTVSPAMPVAPTATTVFEMWSGSVFFFNGGTSAVGFRVFDRWTSAWTALAVPTGMTSFGTCAQLISTGSIEGTVQTGTSTGGNTTTTLSDTSKTWPVNCFANSEVRIVSGAGAGQVRAIASNTANALTVASAWAVTPDATSVYWVEGNDDYLYLLGNNAVTMYRYSITANAWTTLAPVAARGGAMASGGTADWVMGVTDSVWANMDPTNYRQNGRYIYSFRGGNGSALDIYDIAANTWVSNRAYGNQQEGIPAASCSCYADSAIIIQIGNTSRFLKFDVVKNELVPFGWHPYGQANARNGDKHCVISYTEDGKTIKFLYTLTHTSITFLRTLII